MQPEWHRYAAEPGAARTIRCKPRGNPRRRLASRDQCARHAAEAPENSWPKPRLRAATRQNPGRRSKPPPGRWLSAARMHRAPRARPRKDSDRLLDSTFAERAEVAQARLPRIQQLRD